MKEITQELNTNYEGIKQACRKLVKRTIEIKINSVFGDKTEVFDTVLAIFPKAGISKNNLEIAILPDILPLFSRALERYRHYNIIEAKFLTHKHSIEMYKFLKDKANQGEYNFTISIKKLKYELGLESKYKVYSNFKMRVLEPVKLDMINSSIRFDYKEIKPSRSVTDLIISIHEDGETKKNCYIKETLTQYKQKTTPEQFKKDFKQWIYESDFCKFTDSKKPMNLRIEGLLRQLKDGKKLTDFNQDIQESFINFIIGDELNLQ